MIEAVSVAVHAVGLPPARLDDTAVVVGSGMIGRLVVQALRLAGCGRVIAVDLDNTRLRPAGDLGAEACINARGPDVPSMVPDCTSGQGADVALEVVGNTKALQPALASLRKGGTLTLIGNVSPKVELLLQSVVTRQIRADPLISAIAPLTEGAQWFQRLYRGDPSAMKVILQP